MTVTPRVNAPRIEVSLSLPPGVHLKEGEVRWSGAARAHVAQPREVAITVPKGGLRRLVVTARMVRPGRLPMAEVAGYDLE